MKIVFKSSKLIVAWRSICHSSSKRHEKLSKRYKDLSAPMQGSFCGTERSRQLQKTPNLAFFELSSFHELKCEAVVKRRNKMNKKPIPFQKSISNTSWFTKHLNSIDCWLEVSFYFGYRVIRWLIDKSRWLFSKVAESFSSNCCKLLEVAITASNIQSWDFQINAKLS